MPNTITKIFQHQKSKTCSYFSQFFDVRRKDFWEMFIHHNTTIALMMFSWTTHSHRIGSLVLIVHDCADHLLELAKMFRYTRYQRTCDAVFVLFAITWVVTRYSGVRPSLKFRLLEMARYSHET